MRSVNPAVIPRNHKVEEALQAGEEGNFKPFHDLLNAVEKPYDGWRPPPTLPSPAGTRRKSTANFLRNLNGASQA